MFKAADFFDLAQTEHAAIFDGCNHAWEALKKIEPYLAGVRAKIRPSGFPARASATASSSAKARWWNPAR